MPPSLPLPSVANPILHHERKVWIKGALEGSGFAPGNLQFARLDIGTPAVANTDGVGNLTGISGVGFRNRWWAVAYQANSAAHAAHVWMCGFADSIDANISIRMAGQYPTGQQFMFFPGGLAGGANARMTIAYRASIAGPTFYRAMVWYTIEAV